MARLSVTDDAALKVHVAPDGRVWYLDGDRLPEDSGLGVAEFVKSPPALDADKVRALGVAGNAEVLVAAYGRRRRDELAAVEVCSPLAVPSLADRDRPAHVLMALRKWAQPASCGGWHEFGGADFPSYAMAIGAARGHPPAESVEYLRAHPAWPALAAVPHLNRAAVCRLIGLVLDPRFFVDLDHPDRLSKLEAFLGLEAATAHAPTSDPRRVRYDVVTRCWKNAEPGVKAAAADPEWFVWRAYYEAGGGPKGVLAAGRRFVHYLRHTWLDGLYPGRRGESLFAPDHFFDWEGVRWFKAITRVKN